MAWFFGSNTRPRWTVDAEGLQARIVQSGAVPILIAEALDELNTDEARALALEALGNLALDCGTR